VGSLAKIASGTLTAGRERRTLKMLSGFEIPFTFTGSSASTSNRLQSRS